MRIAVDVDGVLADRIPAVLEHVRDRYGVVYEPAEVSDWDVTVPATGKRVTDFFAETDDDPAHLRSLSPVEGAVSGMQTLAAKHELLVATYRKPTARAATINWLERHDIPYDEYVREVGEGKRNVPAEVLIDDSLRTAEAFAADRGAAVLFEQPWNASERPIPNVTRVNGWAELLDHFDPDPKSE